MSAKGENESFVMFQGEIVKFPAKNLGGKKRWIIKGVFAAIRGRKNRIVVFWMILLKFGRLGL